MLLLCCSLCWGNLWAVVPSPVGHKTIIKTLNLLKNDQLVIDNQYGDVEIKTWRHRKVRIIITIATQTQNSPLNKRANRVHIYAGRTQHVISCRTTIDTNSSLSKIQSSVSYVVYAPDDLPLTVTNQFGNINTGDYAGELTIYEKFGDFTAGKLLTAGHIRIEQGSMTIGKLQTGNVTAIGFNTIKIGDISGNASCVFSSGHLLDINFGHKIDTLYIKADNIQLFNLRGLAGLPVKFKLQTKMVKWFNGSDVVFKPLRLSFAPGLKLLKDSLRLKDKPNDTLRQADRDAILDKKKKLADVMLRRKSDTYEADAADAKGKINVDVAFSVLYILK